MACVSNDAILCLAQIFLYWVPVKMPLSFANRLMLRHNARGSLRRPAEVSRQLKKSDVRGVGDANI